MVFVPLVVLFAVANADGKFSYPEANAFDITAKGIAKAPFRPQDAFTRDVMAAANEPATIPRFESAVAAGTDFATILAQARGALEAKVDPTQAGVFRNTMVQLAKNIAEVTPIFGTSMSRDERDVIEMIAAALAVGKVSQPFTPFANEP
ncbi:hypothetical protein [Agromyces sp. ZXT2-6]|uniref:hypothetical protein n=1 Tax=Agromyces sp. ZXT2-6 TaxID=3461153 RepID=UPI004054E522